MLSDIRFRRTAGCKMFESTVFTMKLNKFPIQEVDCEKMDIDELMIKSEFNMPFVVKGISEKLGIKVLPRNQTLTDVASVIGRSFPIKMIEVAEQSEIEGKLGEYADYLKGYTPLHKIINMISLEFSTTELSKVIQAPQFVRDIDWIDTVWPLDRKLTNDYPKVQKYCLSGMASSYTDFHIDFGGTSVWYHVVNGRKRFYLIAPTLRNLQLFKKWSVSSNQADVFFGDVVGRSECFEYDLTPGDTFMIPSGWIHAVYTPEDSLVFGGNFLHKNAVLRQMQVYQIEGNTRVGKKYRFPLFRQINWYTLCMVLPLAMAKYCPRLTDQSLDELDTSDYDPEVMKMSENLNTNHLFHQFLFLVRIADEWVASLSDQYEIEQFLSIAKEYAEMDVMYDVIQKWWAVLESVAVLLDAESDSGTDAATEGKETKQTYMEYLHYIRYLEGQVNLLDEKVVSRALTSFDSQVQTLYDSIHYTPEVVKVVPPVQQQQEEKLSLTFKLRPKPAATATVKSEESSDGNTPLKRLPKENPLAEETSSTSSSYQETLPSTVIDSEYSGEGAAGGRKEKVMTSLEVGPGSPPAAPPADLTSLKFKLPRYVRPTPTKESESVVPSATTTPATDSKTAVSKSELGPSAQAKPAYSSSTSSATSEVPAIPIAVDLGRSGSGGGTTVVVGLKKDDDVIPRPIGREEALKLKRIQEKNKAREILTAESSGATTTTSGGSSAASSKPTRYRITMTASKPASAPKEKPVSNTVGMKTESEGQRKYGTRGLKLSNDFLKNAMDVDLLDEQTQQREVEEQEGEEEEEFHFVDAESRMKGGDEYSGDEEEEEEEGDDVVEYDSAEDDSDHREFAGKAAYRRGGGAAARSVSTTAEDEEGEAGVYSGSDDEGGVVRRRTNKRTQADRVSATTAAGGSADAKKRRLSAADREHQQQQQAKKSFVVDRVSYNSYMGIPQNQPIMSAPVAVPTTAVVGSSFPQARPVVKPKGGRAAIMKKLGIHR